MPKSRHDEKRRAAAGEIRRLRARLAEAEETLQAIRSGDVDAIAVEGPQGRQVFTLVGAEQPYRILTEKMSEGAASIRGDGTIVFCNARLAEMVGCASEKMMGAPVTAFVPPAEKERFQQLLNRGLEGEARGEVSFQRRDGSLIPVLVSLRQIPAEDTPGVCMLVTDLTELKQAHEAVRLQADRHTTMLATSSDGFWIVDQRGHFLDVNDAYLRMSGYSREEFLGLRISDIEAQESSEDAAAHMCRVANAGFERFESKHRKKDGSVFDVEISVSFWPEKEQFLLFARDITQRKRGERAIAESQRRYRDLSENLPQMIFVKDCNSRYVSCNRSLANLLGIQPEQFAGKSDNDFFSPELAEKYRQDDREIIQSGVSKELEEQYVQGERTMTVQTVKTPLRDEQGNVTGVLVIFWDITARKSAEQKLRQQAALLDLAHDAILVSDLQGRVLFWSRGATDTYAFTAEEVIGKVARELLKTEFPIALHAIENLIREKREWEGELVHTRKDGRRIVVASRWSLLRDENGNPTAVLEINRNITERKQAEEQIRKASRYTRALIEASLDPLMTISREGKITDVNEATEKATGFSRAHLIGSDFSNYFTEPQKARQGYEQVFAEGFVRDYPLAIRDALGQVMDVLYNASVFKNEAGEIEGVFAAARDVTERKRSQEQLRKSSLYTRSLIEASLDPLVTISREGKITDVNEATVKATGVAREKLIGSDFCDYFTEPDRARAGYQQVFSEGNVHDYPLALRHRSGRVMEVLYNASVFRNEAGEIEGVFAAARDVTERIRAEAEVRRLNEELEERVRQRTAELENANKELEAFSYSVSHDLRAPLRHICGFSNILLEEYGSSLAPEAKHHLERIHEGTRRMGLLVDDLLNLARVGRYELRRQVTGLNSVLEEVIENLRPEWEGRVVEWKIGTLPYVECDRGLMSQVLQNLLSNALKFTRPRAQAFVEIGTEEQQGVPVIFVRDNGVGFNMKYADKLFGVFQRLHRPEDFEGTGVGLATVQRIIHKHGGKIWVAAELDKGATFYFTLGVAEVSTPQAEDAMAGVQ